ncbi:glutathione S-transferase family protein [Bdellovibrio bacteriovorus]|uniref:glutathione S-transferase family protein n=1 Tax=Bdellovibrio bacteriovorus TaxID=959 RepID=UPI0021CF6068|nr:glutathione S-transferase family protein [Bdellovibrio bacteriovorus]UXR64097.1 glutathione S-transferase family protein [Bdellovibrio bacteriovorus]
MIKIYGSPLSSAGRCYWMMEELGLPYEQVPLNMREKQHKSEEYLKINPNGKVPAIVDGEYVLWESMAITNYLAKKHNSPMAAQNAEEEGQILQWSFWSLVDLQKPAVDWLIQAMFVPAEHRNPNIIADAQNVLPRYLQVLEKGLTGKNYLVGNRFTVADINVASVIGILHALQFDLSNYPNITKWSQTCHSRPAGQKVQAMRSSTH